MLLRYFGDSLDAPCGNCYNCLSAPEVADGTLNAKKALSTVYRTGQKFGVNHLIDVLRGKETEKVKNFAHRTLSTFGIGLETSESEWHSTFRQLLAAGYLDIDIDGYGALLLTAKSSEILKGEVSFHIRKDNLLEKTRSRLRKSERGKTDSSSSVKGPLFEKLRALRLKIAKEQNVPPYVIFHDSTLEQMAEVKPSSLIEMRNISGVGSSKLEKYGQSFLTALQEENLPTVEVKTHL